MSVSNALKILAGIALSLAIGYALSFAIAFVLYVAIEMNPFLGLAAVQYPLLIASPAILPFVTALIAARILLHFSRRRPGAWMVKGALAGALIVAAYSAWIGAGPLFWPQETFRQSMEEYSKELNSRTEEDCDNLAVRNEANKREVAKCYIRIANKTLDVSLCGKIPPADSERGSLDICHQNLALLRNEPSLCEKLTGAMENTDADVARRRCVAAVAKRWPASEASESSAASEETGSSNAASALQEEDSSQADALPPADEVSPEQAPPSSSLATESSATAEESPQEEVSKPEWDTFQSSYFTLSFGVPAGFEVIDSKNSIAIARAPYYTRDIGDDNAFLRLTRYGQYYSRNGQIARYRELLKNLEESSTMVDGSSFLTFRGEDNGRFEGDSAGKVTVVFFDASWLEIIERPANKDQDFDTIETGERIVSGFRFSRD